MRSFRILSRDVFLVADSVHPEYRQVLRTYTANLGVKLVSIPFDGKSGRIDEEALAGQRMEKVAGLVVQSPNFFGVIEETADLAEAVHRGGGLLISAVAEPFAYRVHGESI